MTLNAPGETVCSARKPSYWLTKVDSGLWRCSRSRSRPRIIPALNATRSRPHRIQKEGRPGKQPIKQNEIQKKGTNTIPRGLLPTTVSPDWTKALARNHRCSEPKVQVRVRWRPAVEVSSFMLVFQVFRVSNGFSSGVL